MKIKTYFLIFVFSSFLTFQAQAAKKIDIQARTAILRDFHSGKVLYEQDADYEIYPASMTKIMTAIVIFDLLKKEEISLDDKFVISEKAWRMSQSGYSSMFIMLNDEVTVENLLRGVIIVSGNDACVALAEGISGSEEEFSLLMNEKAIEIGMTNTNFANSSGISNPENYSTVRDISLMSHYLIKNYPNYYKYFSETEFTWDRTGGEPITQGNRNPLLYKKIGADGIKTGYLSVEKYSLASSIFKNNRRLIAVASGFETKNSRSKQSTKLLLWGLMNFDTVEIYKKNQILSSLDVWLGKKNKVDVYIKEELYLTIPKRKKKNISAYIEYTGPIEAPIKKDQKLGTLYLYYQDELIETHNVYSGEEVKRVNLFSRVMKAFNFLVWGDV
jgi:D-alanyl-D-alanine carboxypeptidase (penicillin-binding protein 5/6)